MPRFVHAEIEVAGALKQRKLHQSARIKDPAHEQESLTRHLERPIDRNAHWVRTWGADVPPREQVARSGIHSRGARGVRGAEKKGS